ncbi:hypothetical protein BT96DRAFT_998316 [Gymnopus androsaceus JB14]|uniref:Uncharacterized protein n=1 Tax=Gymnopus androsaceus JB14 TaxID=1447944 RepID=A0A6A4HAC3_9AGAR|nr:hypothetical protein BT96DRAFT_998316 [Gymnopus androsaceus JB14]
MVQNLELAVLPLQSLAPVGRVKSLSKGRAKACKAASPYPVMEASSSGGEVKVMVPSLGTDALDNSMVVNNGFNAYHLLPTHVYATFEPVLALPQGPFSNVINTPIKWQVEDELKAESQKKLSPTTTTTVTTNTAARTIPWAKRIVGPVPEPRSTLMHKKGKMVFPLYRPRKRICLVSVQLNLISIFVFQSEHLLQVAKEPTIAPQTTWYLLDCVPDILIASSSTTIAASSSGSTLPLDS